MATVGSPRTPGSTSPRWRVTLNVDLGRSDLMLETELPRFADLVDRTPQGGKRQYRLTPASLGRARAAGMAFSQLETGCPQRTGGPVTPGARLVWTSPAVPVTHHGYSFTGAPLYMVEAAWPTSLRIKITPDWTPGYYVFHVRHPGEKSG